VVKNFGRPHAQALFLKSDGGNLLKTSQLEPLLVRTERMRTVMRLRLRLPHFLDHLRGESKESTRCGAEMTFAVLRPRAAPIACGRRPRRLEHALARVIVAVGGDPSRVSEAVIAMGNDAPRASDSHSLTGASIGRGVCSAVRRLCILIAIKNDSFTPSGLGPP